MQVTELKAKLESCGLPCAYRMFPEGEAPALPWLVWYVGNERNFAADDENFYNIKQLTVELYSRLKDIQSEEKVEAVLNGMGVWEKNEEYIETERCFQIVYNLEV